MNLVVHQMVQLHHVDVAHRGKLLERLARAPVEKLGLAVNRQAGLSEGLADVLLGGAVEDRCNGLEAQRGPGPAQVGLENLAPRSYDWGTPSGFNSICTGVPSARKGMSSWGRILAITPLLPCRPAILSPTEITRFAAT